MNPYSGGVEERNKIILEHLPYLKKIANWIYFYHFPKGIGEKEDLIQESVIELMDVMQKFDSSKGCSLRTFANKHIIGKLIDYFEKKDRVLNGLPYEKSMYENQETCNPFGIGIDYQIILNKVPANFLDDKEKRIIFLKIYQDKSFEEIGKILGYTGPGIHNIYKTTVKKIKHKISPMKKEW